MKYIDEFRDLKLAKNLSAKIEKLARGRGRYNFMEVCGTHTNTFYRFGLAKLLPENIRLISGPGCPVCVTDASYIDSAITLAGSGDTIITTFGDMIKVPGSKSSLYRERAKGRNIRIVYSSLDALRIAEENPSKDVIFLGVGFETTAPTVAMAIIEAKKRRVRNFFVYSAHKLIPPAMTAILKDKNVALDGFILPAHVSSIIGADGYKFLKKFNIPGVIAGFEPLDMLQGILLLVMDVNSGKAGIVNEYNRVVHKRGNKRAQEVMQRIFAPCDSVWRGIGRIPKSGLAIRGEFSDFDAEKRFGVKKVKIPIDRRCLCGEVIKGVKLPEDCRLFRKVCTPDNPKGPCMVSSEGTCGIHFRYK
ncbi:MAG: hydrogenase formation protein HypD [Candidatus Omnitrophica bacterium]|nr:hydrogenase formation protein HypD [Candidatus Omnitrophota bacterium]MCG2704919.1 hydrogenase formation protein HypD [Candidatus Omnitrophota bacterium]